MKKYIKKASSFLLSLFVLKLCKLLPLNSLAIDAVWPTEQEYQNITTYFNELRNGDEYEDYSYHNAVDIDAEGGSNIYAVYSGIVSSAEWKEDYGNLIIIYHPELGIYTFYAHCLEIYVVQGQNINAGDVIGLVGNTGASFGYHLHYGICDTVLNGWPSRYYYDPLIYFDYKSDTYVTECTCSTSYQGIYATYNVDTFLNIRSGHGSQFPVIGKIFPSDTVEVTKSDGKWAHVIANGVSGYCSMDYLKKIDDISSSMSISSCSFPQGYVKCGTPFSISGIVDSTFPIVKIYGGVYTPDGTQTAQYTEDYPNSHSYDLAFYFDEKIAFNELPEQEYFYRIFAVDSQNNSFELVNSRFIVVSPESDNFKGDANGDSKVNIADLVVLQRYVIGEISVPFNNIIRADLDNDTFLTSFDVGMLKSVIINQLRIL